MVGMPTASGHRRRSTRHKYAAYPTTMATRPAQRTTTSHKLGAAPSNRPSGAVNNTGSGFQPVGDTVLSAGPGPTISRPNTTHAQGSTDGTPGSASEPAATARHPPPNRAPN